MSDSIFTKELYDVEELRYLEQAVENEHLEMLTSIVGTYSEMTKEKEDDIARVLSLLRPQIKVPAYKKLLEDAKRENTTESTGISHRDRPQKVVSDSISLEPVNAG